MKELIKQDFEATYPNLHHKLVNNMNRYAQVLIKSAASYMYQKI